jgi:hypothetical protein
MTTGFCSNCKQNVLLVREEIDWPVAIILLCFTGGIGLIIYLIIYYSKTEDRCVHCHSHIKTLTAPNAQLVQQKARNVQNPYHFQTETQKQQKTEYKANESIEDVKTIQPNFCPFCGERLENKDAKFCPHCGTKV